MRTNRILPLPLLLLLLSFAFILIACGDFSTSDTSSQTPTTPVPTPTETLSQRVNDVVQSANLAGSNIKVSLSKSDLTVSEDVTQFEIGGNGLIVDNIKQGCYDLQKAIWTSDISKHLELVKLDVTMDTQNQYGQVFHGTLVGYCTLTKNTAQKFVWDNLSREDAWNVYDDSWLIPFLTQ